jgi:hypothetical protein
VREVDEAQHAVHHGVPERDQRIDGTEREPVDELLQELGQEARVRPVRVRWFRGIRTCRSSR